jgi:hypothetical protein
MGCPYLRLAQQYQIPYGLVLSFSDAYERSFYGLDCWMKLANRVLTEEQRKAVIAVVKEERERRALVRQGLEWRDNSLYRDGSEVGKIWPTDWGWGGCVGDEYFEDHYRTVEEARKALVSLV